MTEFKYERREPLLTGKNISLVLGGNLILKDLNFQIRHIYRADKLEGQVVGFLAPSGIGKTQTLKLIAGLEKPTTGEILIGQEQKPAHCGLVGVVDQAYHLFKNRTVIGNLLLAARLGGLKNGNGKEKAYGMLEQFGLTEHAQKYPIQLSGGQRQRVAIAQQLLCSEHMILMDEPFSGLDYLATKKVCRFIDDLASADSLNTIIVVSHSIEPLAMIADTAWVMGRDYKDGKPIPGARIQKEYDLIEMGLAWHEEVEHTPQFAEFVREVKARFEHGL